MGKIVFVTGGVRSGKSKFAADLAAKAGKNVVFMATCEPRDAEMRRRIRLHVEARPKNWKTIEEPRSVATEIAKLPAKTDAILLDCLTLLVTNLLLAGSNEAEILEEMRKIIENSKKYSKKSVFISNEVGMGIVPENKLARDFRDISGKVNQLFASKSSEAYLLVSGIPVKLKG